MKNEAENGLFLELQDTEWPFTYTDHDRLIVRAIVYDEAGNLYFMRANRDDRFGRAILIETSGGGVEPGEDLRDAIKRELREELGAEVEIVRKLGLVSDYYNLIHRHNLNHYYLCKVRSFGEKHLTKDETDCFHLSTLKLSFEEAAAEYEKRTDSKLGTLIRNRELPILREAQKYLISDVKKETNMYDLLIIGGGPGGYNAAEKAAKAGLKTAIVEKRALGGVCLNEGCIPTKTLLYSAKLYDTAKHSAAFGVTFEGAAIDHARVLERKNKVVKVLVRGVQAKMKAAGVEVISAEAMILGKDGENFLVQAGEATLEAKKLILATGSEPVLPPIEGLKASLESGFALTSREILDLAEVPSRLAVIGGGVIGLEIASYFNSVGSEVTVLEMLDHIAGQTDREISELLKKEYAGRGVKFLLGARVTAVQDGKVSYEKDGETAAVEADRVLVSIGRRPFTRDLGLENIGVATERGAVVVNEHLETNVQGVYAIGDVNGRLMLAHTAYREGDVAVDHILGGTDRMDYAAIPSVIYTQPEVASVGETTESVAAKGLDAEVKTMTLRYSGRYLAETEGGKGILKLVTDRESGVVLGLHIYGPYASEMIYGAAAIVGRKLRKEDVEKIVFPHPTVSEVIREAML